MQSLADGRSRRATLQRSLGYGVALAVVLIGIALHAHALINRDEAWLLIAAQRMLAGGSVARDFFEVNMPLAVAAYIPAFALARACHLSAQLGITLYVTALSVLSAWLITRALCAGTKPLISGIARPLFTAWVLLGLLCLPGLEFGQREHLIAILGLPFICSVANFQAVENDAAWLRILRAALAGAGFYIKPHYAPLPFLLLGLLAWRRRSWLPLRSLEAGALLLLGIADAAWVGLQYPDWFTCAHWAVDLYGAMQARHWIDLFAIPGMLATASCMALQVAALAIDKTRRDHFAPLVISSIYAGMVYLLQDKGWEYQFLVAQLLTFIGQGLLAASYLPVAGQKRSLNLLAVLSIAGVLLFVGRTVDAIKRQPSYAAIIPIARGLVTAHPGDSVYAFSTEVAPVFPAVPVLGLTWASRYSSLWPALELARVGNGLDPANKDRLERQYLAPFVDTVVEDFVRYSPDYVLVDRRNLDLLPANFDILSMFLADPRFKSIWAHYSLVGQINLTPHTLDFDVYRKQAESAPP